MPYFTHRVNHPDPFSSVCIGVHPWFFNFNCRIWDHAATRRETTEEFIPGLSHFYEETTESRAVSQISCDGDAAVQDSCRGRLGLAEIALIENGSTGAAGESR